MFLLVFYTEFYLHREWVFGNCIFRSHTMAAQEYERLNARYVFCLMPCPLLKLSYTAIFENSSVVGKLILSHL